MTANGTITPIAILLACERPLGGLISVDVDVGLASVEFTVTVFGSDIVIELLEGRKVGMSSSRIRVSVDR